MNTLARYLIAAALLATLAACGNKGPLVRSSDVRAKKHAHTSAPDPTNTAPVEPTVPEPSPDPAITPPATPPGGGNG